VSDLVNFLPCEFVEVGILLCFSRISSISPASLSVSLRRDGASIAAISGSSSSSAECRGPSSSSPPSSGSARYRAALPAAADPVFTATQASTATVIRAAHPGIDPRRIPAGGVPLSYTGTGICRYMRRLRGGQQQSGLTIFRLRYPVRALRRALATRREGMVRVWHVAPSPPA